MLNPLPKKIISVSDFQRKTKPTFDEISDSKEPVLVMNRDKKVGVFLSPKAYDEFAKSYEDYIDSIYLEKAMSLKDNSFITLDNLLEDMDEWNTSYL